MEIKAFFIAFFFVIGLNHGESVSHAARIKLRAGANVDRSLFNANNVVYTSEIYPQRGTKEKDMIERLPGQPPVKFKQYGGYVTVSEASGRAFFYYFVESHNPEKSLPLLLWLNGGPGCSSLGYGAMQELGPFRVHSNGKTLFKNNYAWNYAANLLFLESPAGVGFSYSNTTADALTGGDSRTAVDNYAFLLNWLERFPEYKGREFYIAGESYAGHYVPQLAHTILYHNQKENKNIINLKGIIIGNAVINDETDTKGMYEYFASHALISYQTYDQMMKFCDFSPNATEQSQECSLAASEADGNIENIDIYNIYNPLCHNPSVGHERKRSCGNSLDPCSDYYVTAYLNRPEVQQALHANVTKLHYDWQPCSNQLKKWQDSPSTVIPLLKEFMSNGLRVWLYSGDTDGRIPVTSTLRSIQQMNLTVKSYWHPWYLAGEVGGYTQVYEGNLTFASIRGAGHQVPSFQQDRALSLIMHFLDGTELPNTSKHRT